MARVATQPRTKVCVLSAHSIVLQEIQRILNAVPFEVEPAKITPGAPEKSASIPSAVIYVIDSASSPEGVMELIKKIIGQAPDARLVVLGERFVEESAFPLLKMGVKGLVAHDLIAEQLPRALEAVCAGGFWVPRTLLANFVDSVISTTRQSDAARPVGVAVSRREKEIVDGLLLNLSNKEIAGRLNISERTVKFHVSNLLSKFKVQRRADLILLWFQERRGSAAKSEQGSGRVQ
jgi:DNA-binding NarL/FixJ family response regulator